MVIFKSFHVSLNVNITDGKINLKFGKMSFVTKDVMGRDLKYFYPINDQFSTSYRNQSIDLLCKSVDWFLCDGEHIFNDLKN